MLLQALVIKQPEAKCARALELLGDTDTWRQNDSRMTERVRDKVIEWVGSTHAPLAAAALGVLHQLAARPPHAQEDLWLARVIARFGEQLRDALSIVGLLDAGVGAQLGWGGIDPWDIRARAAIPALKALGAVGCAAAGGLGLADLVVESLHDRDAKLQEAAASAMLRWRTGGRLDGDGRLVQKRRLLEEVTACAVSV